MKKAILHIGTEKTGTTSIQKFLFENRSQLASTGILFPETAGFISNQRLVVFGKKAPEADLAGPNLDATDPLALARWKEQFVLDHVAEILDFHKHCQRSANDRGSAQNSTVIYSAEHLQSRLVAMDEIRRVADLLRPLFDEIQILVYLRRQDKYALSAHSTSVRGGNQHEFAFEQINAAGPYYNYSLLLKNWSEVFGEESVKVRLFERKRLVGGDVIRDFCDVCDIDMQQGDWVMPETENEALSHTALSILRSFNGLAANDPRLQRHSKQQLRGYLLQQVQTITDDFGRVLPSRASAEMFYERFAEGNEWIADRWLNGQGFEMSFDDYPLHAAEAPEVAGIDERLDQLIDAYIPGQKTVAQRIGGAIKRRVGNG